MRTNQRVFMGTAKPIVFTTALFWVALTALTLSSADCAGPELTLVQGTRASRTQPPVMAITESQGFLRVRGEHFFTGCNDTGDQGSVGFFGCGAYEAEVERPTTDMAVVVEGPLPQSILQDKGRMKSLNGLGYQYGDDFESESFDVSSRLTTIDAADDFTFDERFSLPRLKPGRYLLRIGYVLAQFRVASRSS